MSNDEGRVFREAWIAGVHKHFPGDPKPGHVADYAELPGWQRETDAEILDAIERSP